MTDYASLITYTGKNVDDLIKAVSKIRGLDHYHQAEKALEVIFNDIFKFDLLGVSAVLTARSNPTDTNLRLLFKEVNKDVDTRHGGENTDEFERTLIKRMRKILDATEDPKGKIHFEIDSLIKLKSEVGRFEGKMYSSPPEHPLSSLIKKLSREKLEKYLLKQDEFYLLMGFSFLTDESKLDDPAKNYWLGPERGVVIPAHAGTAPKKGGIGTNNDADRTPNVDLLERILEQQPVPINSVDLGLPGTWMLHACIIDRNIFKKDKATGKEIVQIQPKEFATKIMNTTETHQALHLTTVLEDLSDRRDGLMNKAKNELNAVDLDFLRTVEGIQLNICTNFNLLRIHSMSQMISNLEQQVSEYKAELVEKDAKLVEKDAKLVENEAERQEYDAKLLEKDAELLDLKDQPLAAKEKRQQAEALRHEAMKIRSDWKQA